MSKRVKDNIHTARAKASTNKPAAPANAIKGQLVFLKRDGSKTHRRDLYLVLDVDTEQETLIISKLLHTLSDLTPTMQPQNKRYKVKQSDIYLAPNQPIQVETEVLPPPHRSPPLDRAEQYSPAIFQPFKQSTYNRQPKILDNDESDDSEYEDEYDSEEEEDEEYVSGDENSSNEEDEHTISNEELSDTEEMTLETDEDDQTLHCVSNEEHIQPFRPDGDHPIPPLPDNEQPHGPDGDHPFPPVPNLEQIQAHQPEGDHPEWGNPEDLTANPPLPPVTGTLIIYFHPESQQTKKAKVGTTFKTLQRKYPGWFNIINEGERKPISVNLGIIPWRYFSPQVIPQVDGNYTTNLDYSPEIAIQETEFNTPHDPDRALKLAQELNFFIPTLPADGSFVPNQRYMLPPNLQYRPRALSRSKVVSVSEGDLTNTDSARPSRWTRRVRELRNFLRSLFKK